MAKCSGCTGDCGCSIQVVPTDCLNMTKTGTGSAIDPFIISGSPRLDPDGGLTCGVDGLASTGGSGGGGSGPIISVAASDTDPTYAALADFICDGTDDQSEINSAIEVANSTAGGSVLLLPGTFDLTDTIYPTGIMTGSGVYGTSLRYSGSGTAITPSIGGVYLAHFTLQIQFNYPSMPGSCIDSSGGGDSVFDHLIILGGDDTIVKLGNNDTLRNCYVQGGGEVGGLAVAVDGVGQVSISNNRIWANRGNLLAYDCSGLFITNNFIGGSGPNSDGTVPSPYDFYTGAAASGIALIDSTSNIVTGNRIYAIPGSGIYLNNSEENLINSNMIESFGQRNPGVFTYSGVHLTNDSNDNTVQMNRVRSSTFINSKYGIRIDSACFDNFVTNNDLYFAAGQGSPNAANNFSDAGTNTITSAGNRIVN